MSVPDFTTWTDAQLRMTPDHLLGPHTLARDVEVARRKEANLDDGSVERFRTFIKSANRKRRPSRKAQGPADFTDAERAQQNGEHE